jgi:hypothetical protein
MKKFVASIVTILVLLVLASSPVLAGGKKECTTVQDGVLVYPDYHYLAGQLYQEGYDIFDYNYHAHTFNGYFANAYLPIYDLPPYYGDDEAYLAEHPEAADRWFWDYRDIKLVMKWDDAYLSNKDCDGDGFFDRFYENGVAIGSGARLMNHQTGTYIGEDGKEHHWQYFVKIVAAPVGAYKEDGVWYQADGMEIGPEFLGWFAIIQSVFNDPYGGAHGIEYLSPASPGFISIKLGIN